MTGDEGIACEAPIVVEHAQVTVAEAAVFDRDIDLFLAQLSELIGEVFERGSGGGGGIGVDSDHRDFLQGIVDRAKICRMGLELLIKSI